MIWNSSSTKIATAWQTEIETKLEAGATPLIQTGAPSNLLAGVPPLMAYRQFAARRTDITTPLMVAGGSSPLWLGLLLAPDDGRGVPLPAVVFGGPDPVNQFATVSTLSSGALTVPLPIRTGTPPALVSFYAPRLAPGAPAPWEALPFVEVGERPQLGPADTAVESDPTYEWIAWGVLLLALCLVLSALLI